MNCVRIVLYKISVAMWLRLMSEKTPRLNGMVLFLIVVATFMIIWSVFLLLLVFNKIIIIYHCWTSLYYPIFLPRSPRCPITLLMNAFSLSSTNQYWICVCTFAMISRKALAKSSKMSAAAGILNNCCSCAILRSICFSSRFIFFSISFLLFETRISSDFVNV